ncbi:YeeE/YedE thiosulfate transporter family protein [Photobacterium nomapromontoriensis]|uniref:YeeE/YedE thiosulfate transporter family protein n=1 Tax=Photobacterium nomapromontoriensis TaxID=2910237 RepID=UPI003D0D8C79
MINYLLPIFLATIVGFLTQRTGLCMVRAVQELTAKRPAFLFTILCCGFWFWFIIPFLGSDIVSLSIKRYDGTLHFLLGGLLFGLGAAINKGCSISTISKLARGHIYMLATIVGWIIGWCILASMNIPFSYEPIEMLHEPIYPIFIIILLLFLLTIWRVTSDHRPLLFGILLFGICASLLTYLVPDWSPSQLLKDISGKLFHQQHVSWPSLQRYLIIAGLVIGMSYGAKQKMGFKHYKFRLKQLVTHLCAGIIMGLGASLALGGNDSQLLIALPAFSPGGAVSVLFIIIGIATGLALRKALHRLQSQTRKPD